jgi:putative oxidoreductase
MLFLITGLLKIPDLKGFYFVLLSYGLFPKWFARINAYSLPAIEILTGVWLLTGIKVKPAAALALTLLATSTLIILTTLIKKRKIENCGCYGTTFKTPVTWLKLLENCIWITLALILYSI